MNTTCTASTSTATAAVAAASIAAAASAAAEAGEPVPQMRAVVQDRYGAPERLELRTVPRPTPGDRQVLIRVEAAGVDRGVWHLTTGMPYVVRLAGYGLTRPKQPIPGMDVAGTVAAVGNEVTRFAVGDEVMGVGSGTFAEFALADEVKLAHRPAGVDVAAAAVTSISGLTALQAVRDVGRVEAGQRVLVLGASGGVGSFAVQLAKHVGAHVTGVASAAKLDLVRELGADEAIAHTTADALDGRRRYDVIIDTGGRNPVRRLRRALGRRGTLVIVGGEGGGRVTGGAGRQLRAVALSPFVPQHLTTFVSAERGEDVEVLAGLLASGELRPRVDRSHRLADAPTALAHLAAGRVRGKAVIRVGDHQ
jgi:NADPH:quinone reductase-like Zn-dependent oxidoreductase